VEFEEILLLLDARMELENGFSIWFDILLLLDVQDLGLLWGFARMSTLCVLLLLAADKAAILVQI
jgi:hypothetical protein